MSQLDYYKILGVTKSSTSVEIKKSYRKLAIKYHPDKNHGDKQAEEKFKEISESYDVLGNGDKRSKYDAHGHMGANNGQQYNRGFGGNPSMDDLFGEFFGGSRNSYSAPKKSKGRNLRIKLGITVEEIVNGIHKKVVIKRKSKCKSCNGLGSKGGNSHVTCNSCAGRGRVVMQQVTPLGVIRQEVDCNHCQGGGTIIKERCVPCGGLGSSFNEQEEIDINIPKGSRSNMPFAIKGKGDFIKGGHSGDLLIDVFEKEHDKFCIEGDNIVLDKTISLVDAIFGNPNLEIDTPYGNIKINIPPNSHVGKVFRISGKGLPVYGREVVGDMFVYINIEIPKSYEVDESIRSGLDNIKGNKQEDVPGVYKSFREHFIK